MAKIRVCALSKELGIENKDIISFMEKQGVEVKAQSGLDEDQVKLVTDNFSKKAAKAEKAAEEKPAKEEAPKTTEKKAPAKKEAPKAEANNESSEEAPKKKKNISVVINRDGDNRRRHNSRQDAARRQQRPDGQRRPRPESDREDRRGPIRPRDGVVAPSVAARANVKETYESPRKADNRPENREQARPNRQDSENKAKPIRRENIFDGQSRPSRPARPQNGSRPQGGPSRPQNGQSRPQSGGAPASSAPAGKSNGRRPDKKGKGKNDSRDRDQLGRKAENTRSLEKTTRTKAKKEVFKKSEEIQTVSLPERLTISELADRMKVPASEIIKNLFLKGQIYNVNSDIEYEKAEEIALEFNFVCEMEEKVDVIAELLKEDEEDTENLVERPPVVCVMGHVDHGKTSLLDAIRDTKVTDREAGGITQHIGAYMVGINGKKITFLDTPGHEAFTAMRMRGASSTDIAILVVAADDGVMPQTVEAINHAKAAGIEIIVAINKIDKPNANIERVKQELSEYELIPEDWGGSTIFCPVSAHTGEGIDNLLEMILLTAEVLELQANPKRNARGLVIEAQLDKGRGTVATVLVQKGTLHVGDPVAAGAAFGKVRAMNDENGKRIKVAGPSTPVEIIGLSEVPNAGEIINVFDSDKEARSFADTFVSEGKNKMVEDMRANKMNLDDIFSQIQAGNLKELNLIVKADVQGSVEAVKQSLIKLSNDEVIVKVIHGGVGAINESDIILASASNAIIIGFNVRPDAIAKQTADREGVDVRLYKVIYNAIEDVEAAMKGMLDPIFEERVIGHAEIRQIFKSSDVGNIAGSMILDGKFERGCKVRISREGEQIFEGDLASLKRYKDDVKEVKAGYECGLVFDGFSEIREEDQVEAYVMVEVPR